MAQNSFNIQQYLDDPRLMPELQGYIDKYLYRDPAPAGKRYLRNPEDSLIEMGIYTPEGLIEQFLLIISKKSKLSSSLRDCINRYVTQAIVNMYKKPTADGNTEESGS